MDAKEINAKGVGGCTRKQSGVRQAAVEDKVRALMDAKEVSLLAERLARMFILHQLVDPGHQVLKDEESLLRSSRIRVREMLSQIVPAAHTWDEVRPALRDQVKKAALARILEENMDGDLEADALQELEAWKADILHPEAREN